MKKGDIILTACIAFAALIVFLIFSLTKTTVYVAIITQNNEIYGEYSLKTDTEIRLEHNTVTIKDGKAYMSYADCPDKICFSHAPISCVGETVICLPNKIMIEIKASGD